MAKKNSGPWHLVNMFGRHAGPFSTELDTVMARSIATPDWATAIAMNRKTFNKHLRGES